MMQLVDFGQSTFSGQMSECFPLPSSADTVWTDRSIATRDAHPANASKIDQFPLELVLFGSLAKFASQESGLASWSLEQPLQVRVTRDDTGSILVSDDIFLNYGIGDTYATALADYAISLMEFYHLVCANAKVNPLDQPMMDRLSAYLRAKS